MPPLYTTSYNRKNKKTRPVTKMAIKNSVIIDYLKIAKKKNKY